MIILLPESIQDCSSNLELSSYIVFALCRVEFSEFLYVHCVPRTTVSFQKQTACWKIDRFLKIFLSMITNALNFASNAKVLWCL